MNKLKIHFILEGAEEEMLFEIVKQKGLGESFELTYRNANGGGNIPAYYQNDIQTEKYDIVYCVYDVDYSADDKDSMYQKVRSGLKKVLGSDSMIDKISLCTNPNIMLIVLLGCDDVEALSGISKSKSSNTGLINKYFDKIGNKKDYDASSWQLEIIKSDYLYDKYKYEEIVKKYGLLNENYKDDTIGSNILRILKALFENDICFFKKIQESIDI